MRRLALLTALLALAAAAPAAAWIELPPYALPHDGVADCLRAAGPGRVALLGRLGRSTSTEDLLTLSPGGVAPGPSTTLGRLFECAEVGVAPGVTPLLAAPVRISPRSLAAALRVASAGGPPATLDRLARRLAISPSVAVAANGAAVVAWEELNLQSLGGRVVAAFRPAADAPFGPATTLGYATGGDGDAAVGIDAAGHATVAWLGAGSARGAALLHIATTTAGGGFTSSVPLASVAGDRLALAETPGDRTLIANYGDGSIAAYERAPGASTFAPVPVFASGSADEVALAVADDGGAVIAYRSGSDSAFALVRRPGGSFAGEQRLAGSGSGSSFSDYGVGSWGIGGSAPPTDERGSKIAAALDASGHVVITWVVAGDRRGAASAHVARGTIAGGMAHAVRFGSPCRTATAAQPIVLADGQLGAAWTDNALTRAFLDLATPAGGGLLHLLVPGSATPQLEPAAPGLTAQLAGSRGLRIGQPLRLRVRCQRVPCVVRASADGYSTRFIGSGGDGDFGVPTSSSIELTRGHSAVLELRPGVRVTLAPPGRAAARISLIACPATGMHITHLSLRLHLRRVPPRPLPRILHLVARRHGRRIVVTWRTTAPARGITFEVLAHPADYADLVYSVVPGRGRRRFSATLREPSGTHERSVSVAAISSEQFSSTTVRIR
jgi:hypothetical protein